MDSLRSRLAILIPIAFLTANAEAIIQVNTRVDADNGVRAQAVITESNGFNRGGGGVTAVAIKEIHSAIFVIDNPDSRGLPGLSVTKRQLTPSEAYGADLPFGNLNPPTTDPDGPWFGLMWPYRDQYDYFPGPFERLGDDVGTPVQLTSDVYGFIDVDGIARGGPTDPEPAGGSVDRLQRGLTGNGLTGPASYFAFEVRPNFGALDRFVEVKVLSTTARVVVRDNTTGAYSEIDVSVPDFSTFIQLPEPTSLAAAGMVCAGLLARRRRR